MAVTTTPEPVPRNHVREWFEAHIAPDLAILTADVAKFRALAPLLATIADTATALAEAADPAAAPAVAAIAAETKKAAAEIGRIAGELAAPGA
jgi:hypothetical protein